MRKEKNQMQQEEAALSILMDVHAEHDGQRLWQEFQEAQAADAAPVPSRRQEQKWKQATGLAPGKPWQKLLAAAAKAAVWAVAFFAFAAITIVAAEAGGLVEIQTPLWNGYFVSDHPDTVTVHFATTEPTKAQDVEAICAAMDSRVPQGFTCAVHYATYNGKSIPGCYRMYDRADGGKIILNSCAPGTGLVRIPKNGAQVTEIQYMGVDMALLTRPDGWQAVWMDKEEGLYYSLTGQGIREGEFWSIVHALLKC